MQPSSCRPANVKTGLDIVFDRWNKIAADACRRGYFGDIQFTLRIRDGQPHTHVVTRTDTELVPTG